MPPRPRGPFPGRMDPRFMQQPRFTSTGPMMGRAQQMNRGGGGLLAKILGRGQQAGGLQGINAGGFSGIQSATRASGAGAGSFLKTLSNPSAINGFLNNTQHVLKTAQSIGPMIQQYGPLVRNLPAMWKIYRGFKDATSESEAAETSSEQPKEDEKEEKEKGEKESRPKNDTKNKKPKKNQKAASKPMNKNNGESIPKLYI